jgi:cytoskeletal protein CcmA (bactofilin family)
MMDYERSAEATSVAMGEKTIIGSSFRIEGELEAHEDTLIQGRVEGNIIAEEHTVRIGKKGQVNGEVFAKAIIVEGTIEGQLSAADKVVLKQTGKVKGKLLAPQVGMEEGCRFDGEVTMGTAAASVASNRAQRRQRSSK